MRNYHNDEASELEGAGRSAFENQDAGIEQRKLASRMADKTDNRIREKETMTRLPHNRLPLLSAPVRFGDIGNGESFLPALGNLSQPFVKLDSRRARSRDGDLLLPQHEFPVVLVETN